MSKIEVTLQEIFCNKTSFGPGKDDVQIFTVLLDPKNKKRILASSLTDIGDMGPGEMMNDVQLLSVEPAPAFDSLECSVVVFKSGILGSLSAADLEKALALALDFVVGLGAAAGVAAPVLAGPGLVALAIDLALIGLFRLKGSWLSDTTLGSDDRMINTSVGDSSIESGWHAGPRATPRQR